jgi:hypothetical protein
LPIFCGGAIRGFVDWRRKRRGELMAEDDLGKGNLFATGLVAGGALAGVIIALLIAGSENIAAKMQTINLEAPLEKSLGADTYDLLGVVCFTLLGLMLYRTAMKKEPNKI